MNEQHFIGPPPELVTQWCKAWDDIPRPRPIFDEWLATQAARWGWEQRDATVPAELQQARDEELKVCCSQIHVVYGKQQAEWLHGIRRPKPPSLKEQALAALKRQSTRSIPSSVAAEDCNTIRRALEQLP